MDPTSNLHSLSADIVDPVTLTYFKRYRMEISPEDVRLNSADAYEGYRFVSWRPELIDAHAAVKFQSFRHELDANVFPCLGEAEGCRRLMIEISKRDGFLGVATWLAEYHDFETDTYIPIGTVQGVCDREGLGSIQNLGIVPEHRGQGIGSALLKRAMEGFTKAGLDQAYLEVTAQNEAAIRLYLRLGFRISKTVYKAVEVPVANKHALGL